MKILKMEFPDGTVHTINVYNAAYTIDDDILINFIDRNDSKSIESYAIITVIGDKYYKIAYPKSPEEIEIKQPVISMNKIINKLPSYIETADYNKLKELRGEIIKEQEQVVINQEKTKNDFIIQELNNYAKEQRFQGIEVYVLLSRELRNYAIYYYINDDTEYSYFHNIDYSKISKEDSVFLKNKALESNKIKIVALPNTNTELGIARIRYIEVDNNIIFKNIKNSTLLKVEGISNDSLNILNSGLNQTVSMEIYNGEEIVFSNTIKKVKEKIIIK